MFFGSKPDWPIDKAKESIAKDEGYYVDVREEFEVEAGHAEGTIWLPLGKLAEDAACVVEKIKAEYGTDKEYFIYCRSGNRSGQAEMIFKAHGLTAHNIGGLVDLAQKEVPVQIGIPTKVI